MNQTKSNFKALRESMGLSQQDVADALGIKNIKTIKNWENPAKEDWAASDRAWEWIGAAYDEFLDAVETTVSDTEKEDPQGTVWFTYYRKQDGSELSVDGHPAGYANAVNRQAACELRRMGYEVEFIYIPTGA